MKWLTDFFGVGYVRLIAAGIVVGLIAWAGWRVSAWQAAYKALPGVQAELEAEQACAEGSKCWARGVEAKAEQASRIQEVVDGYESELAAVRARPVERRVIRVCPDPGARGVHGGAAAGRPDGAAAPGGVVSGSVELDTGPLRDLARECDEVAARLRGLQGWAGAVSSGSAP